MRLKNTSLQKVRNSIWVCQVCRTAHVCQVLRGDIDK